MASRKPKYPLDKAYIRDDGAGRLSLLIGTSDPQQLCADLTLKAGTTFDEAKALAQAINANLAHVAVSQR